MRKSTVLASLCTIVVISTISSCLSGSPSQNVSTRSTERYVQSPKNSKKGDGTTSSNQTAQKSSETSMTPTEMSPKIQVFLETSGSMNGYVNGGTSIFQQVIKEYLSGINNSGYASEVSYNYITSKVTPQTNDLEKYITRLTPSSFASNGNVATTDIGGVFKQVLSATDPNTVSILISDCIISPGKNVDTKAYLMGQMIDVRDAVVGYTRQYGDLACLVYQIDSDFNGNYFDYQNVKHKISQKRPFYIWVFGHTNHLVWLKLKYVPDNDFRVAPIRNQWMIFNTSLSSLSSQYKYGVILPNTPSHGKYEMVNKTTLKSIRKPSPNDRYRFSFGADLSLAVLLMGEDYINDSRNYGTVNQTVMSKDKVSLRIESVRKANYPYTTIYHVESEQPFSKGAFSIGFVPKVPDWVVSCTDYDDRTFNGSNDDQTYGLETIFNGIFNGFNNAGRYNIIAQFDFEIN